MVSENTPDIIKLIKLLSRHRFIMMAFMLMGAIGGIIYYLSSPRIYKTEAIVAIPETPQHPVSIDSRGNVNALINVYETRYMLKKYWDNNVREGKIIELGDDILNKVKNIEVEDIRGSNKQFNLIVYSKGDSNVAARIIDHLYGYLRKNEYVRRKFEEEKRILDSMLQETSGSISRAIEIRNQKKYVWGQGSQIQFNPVEIETRTIELKEKYYYYLNMQNNMHSYEYVRTPYTFPTSLRPKINQIIFISILIGFIIGLIAIKLYDSLNIRKK